MSKSPFTTEPVEKSLHGRRIGRRLDRLACFCEKGVGKPKELRIIEGADHSLTDLDKLNMVPGLSLEWFKKCL